MSPVRVRASLVTVTRRYLTFPSSCVNRQTCRVPLLVVLVSDNSLLNSQSVGRGFDHGLRVLFFHSPTFFLYFFVTLVQISPNKISCLHTQHSFLPPTTMPLCSACAEHFAFSLPHVVERVKAIKQKAIESALIRPDSYSETYIDLLRRDLERYERQVKAVTASDAQDGILFPLPWEDKRVSDTVMRFYEPIAVWKRGQYERTYGQLRSSPQCEMCIAILSMTEYEATKLDMTVDDDAQIESDWSVTRPDCQPDYLTADVHLRDGKSVHALIHAKIYNGAAGNTPSRPLLPQGTSTEDQSCIKFLVQALSDCLSKHPLCTPGNIDNWLPTRLLDVSPLSQNSTDAIVLIERDDVRKLPGPHGAQYFTLSHVWGKSIPSKLTRDNYFDRKKCIRLDELPRCFRDAVKMTRTLGGKYLWLDALCIIQDSPDDWAAEAACMDRVYANAVCNLAASEATDSNGSLFTFRKYPQSGSFFIHQQEFMTAASSERVVFILSPSWPRAFFYSCKFYRRAWVMQEQFLSRRIIHFSYFPMWQCSTHLIMEGFPPRNSDVDYPFPKSRRDWFSVPRNCDDVSQYEKVLNERWLGIVESYVRKDLTYRTDKLVALSGMAKAFSALLLEDRPYYAGIWGGKNILELLTWYSGTRIHHLLHRPSEDGEYIAPSWSWACTVGALIPEALFPPKHNLAEFISCSVILKGDDIFGQVTGGELVLRGTLFKVHDTDERRSWEAIERYLDNKPSNNTPANSPIFFFPIQESRCSLPSEIHLFLRSFSGLFLKLLEGPTEDGHPKYERVGAAPDFKPDIHETEFLNDEQLDMLKELPPIQPGEGEGDLATII
ncbi:Heterokaryon incompatibility protein (HET) domain containing protein [Naviculisporaceae sp. PSN 640]